MIESRLQKQLATFARMLRRAQFFRELAICWSVGAVAGFSLILIQKLADRGSSKTMWIVPLIIGGAAVGVIFFRRQDDKGELLDLINEMEPHDVDVRHLLATAAEQKPATDSGNFRFLQLRVIEEALSHPRRRNWRRQLEKRLVLSHVANAVALLALIASVMVLGRSQTPGLAGRASVVESGITVTPGDTDVERGTGLVIAARFGGALPPEATLVLNFESGRESRIPMSRQLADPIFGASIPEVSEAAAYHVEYAGKRTDDYHIRVFEFPALVRADAALTYPAYTGLTNRTIRDTLRVSAVQGSRLGYFLQLNKPVARARLINPERALTLIIQTNSTARLPEIQLTNSARYSLELVDADGRSNKFGIDFFLQVMTNQRPLVRLVFPRGDSRVSSLEELQLQAEASDDFGLLKYGVGFGIAGQEPRMVEVGGSAPANSKRQFNYLVSLEKLGAQADQSVAYFAWADDYGPDGEPRRTFSDMFFADVRPFDEVFRQDQSGGAESGSQAGAQGGGNERTRLADLQKQIVVATWNLQREKTGPGAAMHP